MKYADLIAAAPPGFALTVADVGSLGGLHPRWRPFRSVVAGALFDPREPEAADSAPGPGRDFICRTALGERDEEATLHITRRHTMTSTLLPNAALMANFISKKEHTEIVAHEPLRLRALDDVAAEVGISPDVLKIDIQGGELRVLRGAKKILAGGALFVETEVSFFERYEGQPVFRDIESFLADYGFEFIDFHRMKRYRHVNSASIANLGLGRGQRAGRLAFADAFFMLREAEARARLAGLAEPDRAAFVVKAVMILVAYGKADIAARWLDVFGDDLLEATRMRAAAALAKINLRRFGPGRLHRAIDYIGSKI